MTNGRPLNPTGVPGVGVLAKLDGGGNGANTITNVTISGNVVEGSYDAIYLANCSQVSIGNNILDNTYRSAIYLLGSADRVVMASNVIKNANTSANASHAGILASSCDDLVITGNAIIGSENGAKQGINLEGVYSRALVANNELTDCQGVASIYAETVTAGLFANNIIDGADTRGILVSGTNVSITGTTSPGHSAIRCSRPRV